MQSTIKKIRKDLRLTQKSLGKILGVSGAAICHYEKMSRIISVYDAHKIIALAKKEGVNLSLEDIFPSPFKSL